MFDAQAGSGFLRLVDGDPIDVKNVSVEDAAPSGRVAWPSDPLCELVPAVGGKPMANADDRKSAIVRYSVIAVGSCFSTS